MRKVSILLLSAFLYGCSGTDNGQPKDVIKTIEIEGCEYLWIDNDMKFTSNYAFSFTHKGNCKNPIHCTAPSLRREKN